MFYQWATSGLPFFISKCQWQVSNPCSLDYESSLLPLCSRAQPAAANTFLSFSLPRCQWQVSNPWSLDCESSVLPLSYWHKIYVIYSLLIPVTGLEFTILGFELSVLPLCYQGTTLCWRCLFHFFFSQCQWQVSNPCSLDFESGVLPLCSRSHPSAANTFLSFSLPRCQLEDWNPWSLDYESSILPLSYWHKLCHFFFPDVSGRIGTHSLRILVECSTNELQVHYPFLSLSANGRFQTLALWILSLVFYHCAPGHSLLLLIPFCHSLSPVASGKFQILDLWIVNLVLYHCATSTTFMSLSLSWYQWQDWNLRS